MKYKCIVCGVTGSAHAQKAALEAATLAKKENATLIFVYAVDASFLEGSLMAEVSGGHVQDALVKLGNHILDHAEELIRPLGVVPKKVVKRGVPLQVLQEVVLEEKADLLMIGHEERTRIERKLTKGEVEKHIASFKKATGVEVTIVT